MFAPHTIPSAYSNAVIASLHDVLHYDRISIEQLAQMTGHHPKYLKQVFAKHISPTLQDISDICEVLNLRPSETLGEVMF